MRLHEEFLELCAVSTTGELSEDEQKKLKDHLATCSECRRALREFESVADVGMPLFSSELATPNSPLHTMVPVEITRSIGSVISAVENSALASDLTEPRKQFGSAHRNGCHRTNVNWDFVWIPFAAAVLLTAALGVYSYEIGKLHFPQVAQVVPPHVESKLDALEQQLSDAGNESRILRAQLVERDRMIRQLRRRIEDKSAALAEVESVQANLGRSLQEALTEKEEITQEQTGANQTRDAAEASLKNMQTDLEAIQQERDEDESRTLSLEAQINDLNVQLRQSQQTVGKQEDLLADDRDIRDLMGARDLYITEVYDVARDGSTRKPFGRVFYTKGKSLVFYAYDLDQQPGIKAATTFQGWGRRGPDIGQALNLGIFYQDNVSKKRWVLKFDDPRALEQIDAVFVTVEPGGPSQKPSGKSLLFASLRIDSNHP